MTNILVIAIFSAEAGPQNEDELYEMYAIETNRVYQLDPSSERLVCLEELSGKVLTHTMLTSKQVSRASHELIAPWQ